MDKHHAHHYDPGVDGGHHSIEHSEPVVSGLLEDLLQLINSLIHLLLCLLTLLVRFFTGVEGRTQSGQKVFKNLSWPSTYLF